MPGHAVPEPYAWDESFKVFYAKLDDQHKGLFVGLAACVTKPGDDASLKSLTALVEAHFTHEEGMMQGDYAAEKADHQTKHKGFVAKLKGLSVPLSKDTLDFAKDWLVQHIKDTDFTYKGKLTE